MAQDWSGDANSVYKIIGASNHSNENRADDDYYATDPKAVEELLKREKFSHYVWEPACGGGHISKVLEAHGYDVLSSDIVDRGLSEHICGELFENQTSSHGVYTTRHYHEPAVQICQGIYRESLKVIYGFN